MLCSSTRIQSTTTTYFVVWCVEDLEAKLPHKSPDERRMEEDNSTILDRLYQIFVQGNKRRQLR
jgi:hypothetical protein